MIGAVVVVAAPAAAALGYAASNGTAGLDVTQLIGSVVTPVVVIALLLTGKLRTDSEVRNRDETISILRQQLTDKDAQLTALQAGVVDKAIPALTRTALILERLTPVPPAPPDVRFMER